MEKTKEEADEEVSDKDKSNEIKNTINELEQDLNCTEDEEMNKDNVSDNANSQKTKTEDKNVNAEGEDKQEDLGFDEHDDWADVDMNDIVILDEYDSSKNPDEALKEFDEREKQQLTRRYTLPSSPHIIVHPSKTAKGGKFDCMVMSLSVLLDYGLEDTKERFFEVALFAELFNEMLIRDFGFNIYKELYLLKEPPSTPAASEIVENIESDISAQKKNGNKTDDNNDNKKSTKDNSAIRNDESPTNKSVKTKEHRISKPGLIDAEFTEDDNQSIKSERKRRMTLEKSSVDKKIVVVKPQLLLSFVYFDTTHCGYIFEKDLEDLFSILGLNLSRAQIRKVLTKLTSRHAFYYRKLTDKEDSIDAPPTIEENDNISKEDLKKMALGNKIYAVFQNCDDGEASNDMQKIDENGLINYNGTIVHIGKLIDQIKRSEKSFSDLEKLYIDLRKQYTELQREHSKSNNKVKDLQSEVRSLNRKISDTDQDLYTTTRKYRDQQATLSYIYNRVSPYFTKEKDHKSENSRDKDADKSKEKDTEKPSLKENRDKEKTQTEKDEDKVRTINEKSTKIEDKENEKEKDVNVSEEKTENK